MNKLMKVSDLETAYTGCRNRTPTQVSPAKNKIINEIKTEEKVYSKRLTWVE